MVNDLISHPLSKADNICNSIIIMSNDFAKVVGLSYSELWILIMIFVITTIGYYIINTFGALYLSKFRGFFKFMFWGSIVTFFIITLITIRYLLFLL